MYDVPRVTFLIVTDVILVAMLVMMLGACTTPPARYRHGDYIMNVGTAEPVVAPAAESTPYATNVAVANVAVANVAVASQQPRA